MWTFPVKAGRFAVLRSLDRKSPHAEPECISFQNKNVLKEEISKSITYDPLHYQGRGHGLENPCRSYGIGIN
jgi:hypothetical protein